MPILTEIGFTHYAPKDSESGVKQLIIADNQDQILAYVDETCLHGSLAEAESDDEASFYATETWQQDHPGKLAETGEFNLAVNKFTTGSYDVIGKASDLTRWLQSDSWKEVSDLYYGATQYDWDRQQDISEQDANTLVRLGLAKDVR